MERERFFGVLIMPHIPERRILSFNLWDGALLSANLPFTFLSCFCPATSFPLSITYFYTSYTITKIVFYFQKTDKYMWMFLKNIHMFPEKLEHVKYYTPSQ